LNRVLKDKAIFIADAHYPNRSKELLSFLEALKRNPPPQLFLMGDIFDILIGGYENFKRENLKLIELINSLSPYCEIFYFEGNHDFNLSKLFKNVELFSIKNQPQIFYYNDKKFLLSHGDKSFSFSYWLYSKIIRNRLTLFLLKPFGDIILKLVDRRQQKKRLCKKIDNFYSLVKKRAKRDFILVEGHFHQGEIFDNYIALPAFACNNSYAVFKGGEFIYLTHS
jgi:UDP-2,3-diacylglucosamine hydrolase